MAATNDRRRRWTAPLLLSAGYALLLAAWIFGNPPFAAPDEAGHYLRAIGIGNGQPIGEPSDYRDPGRSPKQLAFSRQTAREVSVPAGLAPDYFGCNAFLPELSAGCQRDVPTPPARVLRATHVGAYLPLPYLLPAAAIRAGDGPAADRLGRLASAALVLALLVATIFALWARDQGALSLLGLVAAVTPMVVFWARWSTAAAWRSSRGIPSPRPSCASPPGGRRPDGVWLLLGVSGCLLALSRPLGPAWIVLIVVLIIALEGWGWRNGVFAAGRTGSDVRRRGARGDRAEPSAGGALRSRSAHWAQPVPRLASADSKRLEANRSRADRRLRLARCAAARRWARGRLRVIGAVVAIALCARRSANDRSCSPPPRWRSSCRESPSCIATRASGSRAATSCRCCWSFRSWREIALRHGEWVPGAWRRLTLLLFGGAALLQIGGWYANARRHAVGTDGRLVLRQSQWSPRSGGALGADSARGGLMLAAAARDALVAKRSAAITA